MKRIEDEDYLINMRGRGWVPFNLTCNKKIQMGITMYYLLRSIHVIKTLSDDGNI